MTVPGQFSDIRDTGAQVSRDVTFNVPLAKVPAGAYVARAIYRIRVRELAGHHAYHLITEASRAMKASG